MESTEMLSCENLLPGSTIDVETKSRRYRIECLGGNSIRVSGHPQYCPEPVAASLRGSLDQEGVLEIGFIGCGMRMIFLMDDMQPVTTSRVLRLHVEQPSQTY